MGSRVGRERVRGAFALLLALCGAGGADASVVVRDEGSASFEPAASVCVAAADRASLPDVLLVRLRSAAFPGAAEADAAIHVPKGFDVTRRPGLVVYFHGWQGCVRASLESEATTCGDGGDPRPGSGLAEQIDAAAVNAVLIAVELRVDRSTGEPGELAMPGGLRALLDEALGEQLSPRLGCPLLLDAIDRVEIIAHSGGYQAAASALRFGDVPAIAEVDLLDALYGGDETFARFVGEGLARYDPRAVGRRFVNLYTCCGGTLAPSRTLAEAVAGAAARSGWPRAVSFDDADAELERSALESPFVFKRVPQAHGDLPRAYVRSLVEAAGFAPIRRK
jgi:hypothetical protein